MIRIELALAISLLLSFVILLVFAFWISYNYKEEGDAEGLKHFVQCPYCTHVFFDYKDAGLLQICPNCKSYIEPERLGNKNTKNVT